MKKFFVVGLLPLLGCAGVFPSAKDYNPVVARLVNKVQYDNDLEECHWTADNLPSTVSVGNIAEQTFTGATNNGATGIINPLSLAGGAVGGALGATVGGYDLTGQNSIKVLVLCIAKITYQDGSAIVSDPHE